MSHYLDISNTIVKEVTCSEESLFPICKIYYTLKVYVADIQIICIFLTCSYWTLMIYVLHI